MTAPEAEAAEVEAATVGLADDDGRTAETTSLTSDVTALTVSAAIAWIEATTAALLWAGRAGLLTTADGLLKTWISARPTWLAVDVTASAPQNRDDVDLAVKLNVVALPSALSGPRGRIDWSENWIAQLVTCCDALGRP